MLSRWRALVQKTGKQLEMSAQANLGWVKHASSSATVAEETLPVVAIVGAPNVGKSRLFNRLTRDRKAIVANTPESHVTRDYQEGVASLADMRFRVVDTSGLEPLMAPERIPARATQITAARLSDVDVALMMIDARAGVIPADQEITRWLRAKTEDTCALLLVANKAERRRKDATAGVEDALIQATTLGLGPPVAISAETGEGLVDLYAALQPLLDAASSRRKAAAATGASIEAIKVVILGLSNVGKSTLANHLLNKQRSLTGPEPHLTRDTVRDRLTFEGQAIELADTAGWVKPALKEETLDPLRLTQGSMSQARSAVNMAHVGVLVVSADHHGQLTRREVNLAATVIAEGRPLIVAINKLDLLKEGARKQVIKSINEQVESKMPEISGLPCIGMSALKGTGTPALLPTVVRLYNNWNQKVATYKLNKWLIELIDKTRGSGTAAQALRIRYAIQTHQRPPTFAVHVGGKTEFPNNCAKMVRNSLRETFGLQGVPLRVYVRMKGQK
ncbi:hypothetical protein WJX73_000298 [Symbiochloris irregularis]|uniref:GTPase Der n=1 Tax=Symbiochloris irregularis TaxID=706552 RepID=A0AAW1NNC1_9CHLO